MERVQLDVLREALLKMQRKETVERAVGKAVRAKNLDFSAYVQIMGEVREFAHKHGISEIDAAHQLLREGDDKT